MFGLQSIEMFVVRWKAFTGQEIEDVHIFGGQTPVKRLENLNVCRENEFFSQLLNDQIRSS